jgi:hypothetical protein
MCDIWGSHGGEDVEIGFLGCGLSMETVCSYETLVSTHKSTRRYNLTWAV